MSETSTDRPALLLVGHGTRDLAGQAGFLALADRVGQASPDRLVQASFLELAQPTIAEGVARLVSAGVRQITVAPLLLFSAGHAQRDVPAAVAAAIAEHGRPIEVRQAAALEAEPSLVALSAQRFRESLAGPHDPAETLAVIVARGSRDPQALSNLERFVTAWRAATGQRRTLVGFAAMATPTLSDALATAASSPAKQVVVVRHFLFAGELPQQVEQAACQAATRNPAQSWRTTPVLGPDPLLAQAVLACVEAVECERVAGVVSSSCKEMGHDQARRLSAGD